MRYTETLDWILDKPGERGYSDENVRLRIDFVHSLKLKCDCVGWSRIDLSAPEADALLDLIEAFCREDNWNLRAHYERHYSDIETDWYVLREARHSFAASAGWEAYPTVDGGTAKHPVVKACNFVSPGVQYHLVVPERFRDACLRAGVTGLDFCGIRDKGRYDAPACYTPYAAQTLPRFVFNKAIFWKRKDEPTPPRLFDSMGGSLPRLGRICSELRVSLPECVFRADLPAGGVVQAYAAATYSYAGCRKLLIHKDTAELLLREGACTASALEPLMTVDELPEGCPVCEGTPLPRPTPAYFTEMDAVIAAQKAKARPVKQVTEKTALALLRKAKSARKEDFGKRLAKADEWLSTACAPLVPYWKIAGRGFLSDEYELLSPEETQPATQAYDQTRAAEELADLPEGVIFARCPDGDVVLLAGDGRVLRISHEEPLPEQTWPGLPAFIADAVEAED